MDLDRLLDALIEREGGYSHNPLDRGGATRWGITEAVARSHGYAGPMNALPESIARRIYTHSYWTGPGLDKIAPIAPDLAAELFDTAVNMGPMIAIRFLQRALTALNGQARSYPDISIDGRIGPETLSALQAYIVQRGRLGEQVLIRACDALQGARYIDLAERRPANEAFLYGWLATRTGHLSSNDDHLQEA